MFLPECLKHTDLLKMNHTRKTKQREPLNERGECEQRVILGKGGLPPFRGKQQSGRSRSHRRDVNRARTSDCGPRFLRRNAVTPEETDERYCFRCSQLGEVHQASGELAWLRCRFSVVRNSEDLRITSQEPAPTRSFQYGTMQTPEPKQDTKRLFISQPI